MSTVVERDEAGEGEGEGILIMRLASEESGQESRDTRERVRARGDVGESGREMN